MIDKLVDLKTDAGKLETELSGLSPLPEGYSDSGTFIQEYNNSKEEYDNTKDKLAEKINERTTYEKKAPEKTQREVEEKGLKRERRYC